MFSLKDKVALITGASQGIGRDTALALAQAGAKVAVAARNEEKLASPVSEIESAGGAALAVKMDVADADQVKAGFKAGPRQIRPPRHSRQQRRHHDATACSMRMKPDDWEAVLKTNLTGAHFCIQQALST